MGGDPTGERDIKLQYSVTCREVARFTNKPEQQTRTAIMRHRKADGIAGTTLRQPRAGRGVTKIATLAKFVLGRFNALVTGRGTVPMPAAAQRQTRRMQPAGVIELAGRHEKWAGHEVFSLWKGQLYQGRNRRLVITELPRGALEGAFFNLGA